MNQYYERSQAETGVYIPSALDLAYMAKDAYMALWNVDYGVAEWQKYEDKAFHFYMASLYSLEDNQGWNPELVQLLRQNAIAALQESHTAAQFWAFILATEQQVIIDSGYNPSALPNYAKHVEFMNATSTAVEGYRDILSEYSPHQQIWKGQGESFEDFKKILIVGFAVLIGVQVLK